MKDKFIIKCLACGSNNVHVEEEIDYDWDETPYISGFYLKCHDCKSDNLYDDYLDEDESDE